MSGIYAATSQAMSAGAFNWTSGAFGAMLIGPGYDPDYVNNSVLTDVPAGAQLLSAPVPLTGEAISGGFCGAANLAWSSLTTPAPIMAVLIVQNISAGSQPVWRLVCLIDQGEGLGQTAQGTPVNLIFDSRGIFRP